MTCQTCGTENAAGYRYCIECGVALAPTAPKPSPETTAPAPSGASVLGSFPGGLVGAVVAGAGALLLVAMLLGSLGEDSGPVGEPGPTFSLPSIAPQPATPPPSAAPTPTGRFVENDVAIVPLPDGVVEESVTDGLISLTAEGGISVTIGVGPYAGSVADVEQAMNTWAAGEGMLSCLVPSTLPDLANWPSDVRILAYCSTGKNVALIWAFTVSPSGHQMEIGIFHRIVPHDCVGCAPDPDFTSRPWEIFEFLLTNITWKQG